MNASSTLTAAATPAKRSGIALFWGMTALVLWGAAIAFGFLLLLGYKHRPQDAGTPPAHWPNLPALRLSPQPMTLLVFSHPHCPCTRATFRQLDYLLAAASNRADLHIVIVDPAAAGVADAPMTRAAAQLSSAKLHFDDGELARSFGVKTSGHVLLYDGSGSLRYSGGVTPYRGHEGPSEGSEALKRLLGGASERLADAPVYGCPLFTPVCRGPICAADGEGG